MQRRLTLVVAAAVVVGGILILLTRANPPDPTEALWYSTARGRIVFQADSPGIDHKKFYVVSLPSFDITFRTEDQSYEIGQFPWPRWERSGRSFLVGGREPGRPGLCRVDVETGAMELVSAWKAVGPDIPVHLLSAPNQGRPFRTELSLPNFGYSDFKISVGPASGNIFAVREFQRNGEWPRVVPRTTQELAKEIAILDSEGTIFFDADNNARWVGCINASGSDSLLFRRSESYNSSFEVGKDESIFAFGDGYAIEIFNSITGRRHFLTAPEQINLRDCRFSATDGVLAITSIPERRLQQPAECVLYLSPPPAYDSLEFFKALEGVPLSPPVWSPDGEWIMIQNGDRSGLFFEVIRVETRASFRVYPKYRWRGETLEGFGLGSRFMPGIGDFDWAAD